MDEEIFHCNITAICFLQGVIQLSNVIAIVLLITKDKSDNIVQEKICMINNDKHVLSYHYAPLCATEFHALYLTKMDIYPERYYLRPLPENKDWESLMAGAAGEYFLPRAPSANFPVAV